MAASYSAAYPSDESADRRAWHLAGATTGTDEVVTADLDKAAERARTRGGGGYAAVASAYERAAQLTLNPSYVRNSPRLRAAIAHEQDLRVRGADLVEAASGRDQQPRHRRADVPLPRTVGYHLYKAFPKLGISSRNELSRMDLREEDPGRVTDS